MDITNRLLTSTWRMWSESRTSIPFVLLTTNDPSREDSLTTATPVRSSLFVLEHQLRSTFSPSEHSELLGRSRNIRRPAGSSIPSGSVSFSLGTKRSRRFGTYAGRAALPGGAPFGASRRRRLVEVGGARCLSQHRTRRSRS